MGDGPLRVRLRCRGTVQGVGFRPSVYRLATDAGLTGWVVNDPEGATAEVQGPGDLVEDFVRRLPRELPPLARLDDLEVTEIDAVDESVFEVRTTRSGRRTSALVPPDARLCDDCRREMEDPADRRFHYPFTTCTNCGPRFSLVHELPYDRERTAMACFPLCPECRREYESPADRRFHAEPVCCPACGPSLLLVAADGSRHAEGPRALEAARAALAAGEIVAVKGLGGFQLACRADDPDVVSRLRHRKRRPGKPFAVMVPDIDAARAVVFLSAEEEALLRSARSPVILAPRRPEAPVSSDVAPGLEDLGVLLPTTPLHAELLRDASLPPLVMTSGNLSEEPICKGNREALERLGCIADLFLLHDRDIVRRVDDSVVRSGDPAPFMVRRARGWVPEPLPLPSPSPEPVLAVGGHLQATACLVAGSQAFCSQHVGDLDSEPARSFLREVIAGLEQFLEVTPRLVVADLHPDYPSRWLAEGLADDRDGRLLGVQHHLAHAAAVLAEHEALPEPSHSCLAICLDGTGWGPDGTAWGGEVIRLDGSLRWHRLAHLEPMPLIGGEQAVREPWRVAVALLARAGCAELIPDLPMSRSLDASTLASVATLSSGAGWTAATGAGRLFEACGAMLGLASRNRFEGEAAARLESLASMSRGADPWPDVGIELVSGVPVIPSSSLIATAARRLVNGEDAVDVAAGFHGTFSALVVETVRRVASPAEEVVAVGGGCLVNRILRREVVAGLRRAAKNALLPIQLPAGDGGLAYGQAVLGSIVVAQGLDPACLEHPVEGGGGL